MMDCGLAPLRSYLEGFLYESQKVVNGDVQVVYPQDGTDYRASFKDSLYDEGLATYSDGDTFDKKYVGFLKLYGLSYATV